MKLQLLESSYDKQNTWTPTDSFAHLGPIDRNFIVDRERAILLFGDGLNGRLPVPEKNAADLFEIEYEVGGGTVGNLPSWQLWRLLAEGGPRITAVNVVSAQGGDDAESVAQTVLRSKAELRRAKRAVTREDIEQLACKTAGAAIKRAHAAVGLHPQYPCLPVPGAVTVFLVPDLPESLRDFLKRSCGDDLIALRPDEAMVWAVQQHLDTVRVLTQEVFVEPPIYEPVSVKVTLVGTPADSEATRELVVRVLHDYLHPLFGGPERVGWPFGAPLRPSELTRILIEVIDSELAVKEVEISRLASAKIGPAKSIQPCCSMSSHSPESTMNMSSTCNDMSIGPHALVELRHVDVKIVSPRNTVGGLR